MNEDHGPAEPAGDDKEGPTGFAGVARWLNREYPNRKRPISRQLVHKWYLYRHHNGFPASIATTGRPAFDITDVEQWYVKYRSSHGEPHIRRRTPHTLPENRPAQNEGENPLAA